MHDLITELVAQHLGFSFLSKALYEPPTTDFIQPLVDDALFDTWPVENDNEDIQTGLATLRDFCVKWQPEYISELKRDYTRLFLGPDRLVAPPWESVYRSDEHLMFERQTLEVRAAYQRYGMPIPNLNIEPDDHIGLELRFVAYLYALALGAIESGEPEQLDDTFDALRRFFTDHLTQWAPACLERVYNGAQTDYYRGVARLALGSLQVASTALHVPQVAAV